LTVSFARRWIAPADTRNLSIQSVASSVEVSPVDVRDAAEIERAINAFALAPNGGLIVVSNPTATVHRKLIITLAARHRLPAVYRCTYW
jgi:putative ABC transport system substrate-binding protein